MEEQRIKLVKLREVEESLAHLCDFMPNHDMYADTYKFHVICTALLYLSVVCSVFVRKKQDKEMNHKPLVWN